MHCILKGGEEYTVILKMTDDTTVSRGYCVIVVGDKRYKTESINKEGTDPFCFTLAVSGNEDVSVTFSPIWGMPAEWEIEKCGTIEI